MPFNLPAIILSNEMSEKEYAQVYEQDYIS